MLAGHEDSTLALVGAETKGEVTSVGSSGVEAEAEEPRAKDSG